MALELDENGSWIIECEECDSRNVSADESEDLTGGYRQNGYFQCNSCGHSWYDPLSNEM